MTGGIGYVLVAEDVGRAVFVVDCCLHYCFPASCVGDVGCHYRIDGVEGQAVALTDGVGRV
jgi:hypothetical protein